MKGYDMSGNPTVIKLASVEITGNVVPLEWFNHIKRPNGKPYTDAIFLLSDIVYWYRPIEVRDELTGKLLGLRKKFKADKLQRDYNSFAEQYGYTKNQVRDALGHLEKVGLIDLDFRHITVNGKKLGNVLFIGLNSDALMKITTLSDLKLIGCEEISQDPPDFKADTNTETTTETTKKKVVLSKEEIKTEGEKVDKYFGLLAQGQGKAWTGRETFLPQHLPLVDWYHGATGQDCPKGKRAEWMKAVGAWAAAGLTVEDLQAAYNKEITWRGFFKSPLQLTDAAMALKAQKSAPRYAPRLDGSALERLEAGG